MRKGRDGAKFKKWNHEETMICQSARSGWIDRDCKELNKRKEKKKKNKRMY